MRIACCITKITDTHSEYVVINAFTQQQWLRERAPVLRLNLKFGRGHANTPQCYV